MNMKLHILILGIALLLLSLSISAQEISNPKSNEKSSIKPFDYFIYTNSEMGSLRIDNFLYEVNKDKNSKGVLVLFCGKTCQYGEVEAHIRGIKFKLKFRGVNTNDYPILIGGYREETSVEFWIVPENACLPIPKSTVNIEDVKFKGAFKRKIVPYECCADD